MVMGRKKKYSGPFYSQLSSFKTCTLLKSQHLSDKSLATTNTDVSLKQCQICPVKTKEITSAVTSQAGEI